MTVAGHQNASGWFVEVTDTLRTPQVVFTVCEATLTEAIASALRLLNEARKHDGVALKAE